MCTAEKDNVNADLLAFKREVNADLLAFVKG